MKKLLVGLAVMAAAVGLSGKEAKADCDTLSGVANIIAATGTFVNPGYVEQVYYSPAPVVYYEYPVYHRYYNSRSNYRPYYRPQNNQYNHNYPRRYDRDNGYYHRY